MKAELYLVVHNLDKGAPDLEEELLELVRLFVPSIPVVTHVGANGKRRTELLSLMNMSNT